MLILKLQGEADEDANRCWLVLDEVQDLQRLPQLPKALTRQRKSGNPIVIGFQGMSQIDANYGKQAETMLSQPFYNFILRTQESRAAKHQSERIGNVQIERVKETRPANLLMGNRQRSYSTERVIEPLVMPSEIQELEDLTGYFVAAGRVVKITFDVREKRRQAPGLIERMIPNVQTRPLNPEPDVQRSTEHDGGKSSLSERQDNSGVEIETKTPAAAARFSSFAYWTHGLRNESEDELTAQWLTHPGRWFPQR